MAKYIIPGGSGFMGQALSRYFTSQGHEVVILTRRSQPDLPQVKYLTWDGKHVGDWASALEGADAVINLAGKSVNCRYTEENKRKIYDSRIDSTKVIGEAIAACKLPPKVWMNASTATIYRHAEDRPMTESTGEYGAGMSVNVARDWEHAFLEAEVGGVRKIALRTAIVIALEDGAFPRLLNLARTGLGGTQGNGEQMMSWIHIVDVVRAIQFLLDREDLSGAFNLAAPGPVSNKVFMETIRKAVGMPFALPMPEWLLKIGAFIIGTETELILKSRWVLPERLAAEGFEFSFPAVEGAVEKLVGRGKRLSGKFGE